MMCGFTRSTELMVSFCCCTSPTPRNETQETAITGEIESSGSKAWRLGTAARASRVSKRACSSAACSRTPSAAAPCTRSDSPPLHPPLPSVRAATRG
eukprot:1033271-Rhodomonas_salina.5